MTKMRAKVRITAIKGYPDDNRGCIGKEKFPTIADAQSASRNHRRLRKPVGFYRCQFCGFYHLGTTKKRKIR